MFRRICTVASLVILMFGIVTTVKAQRTANVTGVASDSSKAVIPGATVTLRNPQTGVELKAITGNNGAYTFNLVPAGPGYEIHFEAAGFSPVVIKDLYLNVDDTRTQNATMRAGTTVTVEVSAGSESETVNTTDAQVGNNVQVQVLNELPIETRDSPSALFTMLPGVTAMGSVTGSRTDQSNVTLDGLDVNDNETGNFGAVVANAPVDSVQEFRGIVGGQLSSSGEGGGGQFQLVTRGGTNQFHGNLSDYYRNTVLEANDWFSNNSGVPRSPLIRNQFGGSIGGPVKRDKIFFFFNYEGRRDTLSNLTTRTVPLDSYRSGSVNYFTNQQAGTMNSLSPTQVAALDPLGIGYNSALLSLYSSRYPHANDFSGKEGDLVNTAGYTFNAPFPLTEDNYTQRVDYKLNSRLNFEGVGHFTRLNDTQSAVQFPGDPETFPFVDQSYDWAGINTWVISSNKTNQVELGETYENYSFPCTYNPEGATQFGNLGGTGSGGIVLSGPYASCTNAQGRTYPILMIKDDFDWQKGRHDFAVGGQIKRISPDNFVVLNYNGNGLGLGGFVNSLTSPGSEPSMRPSDLDPNINAKNLYDSAYALALAPYSSTSATYNFNNQAQAYTQGSGATQDFRFYETEIYAGDTWKITPKLTISYGVRWQYYSVPYERHGLQSLAQFGSQSISDSTFNYYFGQREAQSAAGQMGTQTVPLISYVLGGKANGTQSYYAPEYHDFAPRVAFAWAPGNGHTVFRGGGGIVYDHTVISAIQYQQTQFNYLFKNSVNDPMGTTGNAYGSYQTLGRFNGLSTPPTPPSAPAIATPYYPWVQNAGTSSAFPNGLLNGEDNETIDPHFKNPFSFLPTFGMQHEFPKGFILKTDYVGRFGRRLMAQADASQLIDFPDAASGQTMSQAVTAVEKQVRAGVGVNNLTPQPWFEDVATPGFGVSQGFSSNTAYAANQGGAYPFRGDFADWIFSLAGSPVSASQFFLPPNVGMAAQFAENTVYTNKGFSGYNGALVTLHKNSSFGLTFDINYTWSHAIDNVSVTANTVAYGGYGFICDVVRPRECRGNSDFDVTHYINGYFVYDLPFGHGRAFGGSSPRIVNEFLGGWSVSGLPGWHTGFPYFAGANAFVAGFSNDAPAILTGDIHDMDIHIHGGGGNPLQAFRNTNTAVNDYTGPVGFQIGSRNDLRGPRSTTLDAGLSKTFPVVEKVVVKLRGDAFNVMNHPVFGNPATNNIDITQSSAPFGLLTSDTPNGLAPRVLQVSLRVEF
ncbi:carboxypeptidase regulatory-like domain-containing protein [Terracidiphilus sp.]|uniref:carboxypeptidase regulatory-like domain-containing protein n=1 Tax=Terracidiphilus sp. TaxID=1964191 RepID=UPI003C25DF8D